MHSFLCALSLLASRNAGSTISVLSQIGIGWKNIVVLSWGTSPCIPSTVHEYTVDKQTMQTAVKSKQTHILETFNFNSQISNIAYKTFTHVLPLDETELPGNVINDTTYKRQRQSYIHDMLLRVEHDEKN